MHSQIPAYLNAWIHSFLGMVTYIYTHTHTDVDTPILDSGRCTHLQRTALDALTRRLIEAPATAAWGNATEPGTPNLTVGRPLILLSTVVPDMPMVSPIHAVPLTAPFYIIHREPRPPACKRAVPTAAATAPTPAATTAPTRGTQQRPQCATGTLPHVTPSTQTTGIPLVRLHPVQSRGSPHPPKQA